ncbi:hypothetical protein [Microbacterium rhizomatis]|uniref:Uncharacterized protein n=1 Tax=Microbacterium rhizomatis TaxID=1631477 RepID=A0A5J5J2Q2_9MICO|nr:hypothetical protein [Microbacterium rhizomatis]KAA9110162.1 hypothetical protein F6B43_00165 [Microbacterium rhizomatis]
MPELLNHWLVQGLVVALVAWLIGLVIKPSREWMGRMARSAWRALRDIRVTRETTVQRRVDAATEARASEVSSAQPPGVTPKARRAPWSIRADHDRVRGWTLTNLTDQTAAHVSLFDPISAFKFEGAAPQWIAIHPGESQPFEGHIANDNALTFGGGMRIEWTDPHGDNRTAHIVPRR